MSAPRYYSWTDPGAPQLIAENVYALPMILRQCLVGCNGIAYANKPAAGWNLYAEDRANCKFVVQSPGGNQRFFHLSDPQVFNTMTGYTVRMYESMKDVDGGWGQNPKANDFQTSVWALGPWSSNSNNPWNDPQNFSWSNNAIPWYMLVSDTFFYIKIDPIWWVGQSGTNTFNSIYFFGDLTDTVGNDPYATVLWSYTQAGDSTISHNVIQNSGGGGLTSPTNFTTAQAQACAQPFTQINSPLDTNTTTSLWIMRPLSGSITVSSNKSNPVNIGYNQSWAPQVGLSQPFLGSSFFDKKTIMNPVYVYENGTRLRGRFPGLYVSSTNAATTTDQHQWTDLNGVPWILWKNWVAVANSPTALLSSDEGKYKQQISPSPAWSNMGNFFFRMDQW